MADERDLIESFTKSRFWKWTREYLVHRREQLFNHDTDEVAELWKNKGAILEINRLLKAPQLVLEFYRRQQAADTTSNGLAADAASTSAVNRSPFELTD